MADSVLAPCLSRHHALSAHTSQGGPSKECVIFQMKSFSQMLLSQEADMALSLLNKGHSAGPLDVHSAVSPGLFCIRDMHLSLPIYKLAQKCG